MNTGLSEILNISSSKKEENKKFFKRLQLKKYKQLDAHFHRLHESTFSQINCLQCANCCSTTSPIFYAKDIERLSKHFRLKPSQFMQKYLKLDQDGDYVLTQAPCPFLGADNYCSVYEARPKACREYPHTNRKNMQQILQLTQKNVSVCPAVAQIVEKLKAQL